MPNDEVAHREAFPEQYEHPFCGKRVRLPCGRIRTVVRVVRSRFGQLAITREEGPSQAYSLAGVELAGEGE